MANNGTGYIDPTGTNGPTGVPYDSVELQIGETNQVGELKLGAVNTVEGSVGGTALRRAYISFNANVNTQISVVHNLVDENGNPAVPVAYGFQYTNGDGIYFSQAADDTNLYVTAPAGATTAVTGEIWALY